VKVPLAILSHPPMVEGVKQRLCPRFLFEDDMLKVIYKYEIPVIGKAFELNLPIGHAICDINHQNDKLYMWIMVDPDQPKQPLKMMVVGTGWVMKDCSNMWFMKTIHMPNGLVWHLFGVEGRECSLLSSDKGSVEADTEPA